MNSILFSVMRRTINQIITLLSKCQSEYNQIFFHVVDIDKYYNIHMHHRPDWIESKNVYNQTGREKKSEKEEGVGMSNA